MQVIVQRALAAKSLSHAQGATIMAGFVKILPLFIMVLPGMMARVLYPGKSQPRSSGNKSLLVLPDNEVYWTIRQNWPIS